MQHTGDRASVIKDISAIPAHPRVDLIDVWTSVYGRSPPKGLSRRLLEYAAAYQIQAKAFSCLTTAQRNKLRRLAKTRSNSPRLSRPNSVASNMPAPGSRLVREWHGRTYMVEVTQTGLLCDGQHYRSLSEVARAITGARWSGPRFFGL